MHSIQASPEVAAAFDALDAAVAAIGEVDFDRLDPVVRLRGLERLETSRRHQAVIGHDVISGLAKEEPADIGGPVFKVVADRLRISYAEARRRMRDAEQLSPRVTLTGEVLPPDLAATAVVWRQGLLDTQHLKVIQGFCRDLPDETPAAVAEQAEKFLAHQATQLRPDQLEKVANRAAILINPDGTFSDIDRARQRGFTWCGQRPDGMSLGKLIATPELRAYLDAWFAKFAAPGMANPDNDTAAAEPTETAVPGEPTASGGPTEPGGPTEDAISTDRRTPAQRQHDALRSLLRRQLGDPALGQHKGLPVAVVVSTTLQELTAAAGLGVTASGTVVPMPDLIRMASRAYHYLAIYDQHDHRPLYLGRSRRLATADQRLMLYNLERGCTHPGCDVAGDKTEIHHLTPWSAGGTTDITNLTLASKPHHKLTEKGWKTTKNANGQTQWIPPPHLDTATRTNDYHHPERLLEEDDGDGP